MTFNIYTFRIIRRLHGGGGSYGGGAAAAVVVVVEVAYDGGDGGPYSFPAIRQPSFRRAGRGRNGAKRARPRPARIQIYYIVSSFDVCILRTLILIIRHIFVIIIRGKFSGTVEIILNVKDLQARITDRVLTFCRISYCQILLESLHFDKLQPIVSSFPCFLIIQLFY